MPYDIDLPPDVSTDESPPPGDPDSTADTSRDHDAEDGQAHVCGCDHHSTGVDEDEDGNRTIEDVVGITIPDEHVGAFVAEAFEDAERDTSWDDVVDAFVDPASRPAWDALDPRAQAVEILDAATRYDEQATEHLESIPLDAGVDLEPNTSESAAATDLDAPDATATPALAVLEEALRCRRNADTFRDGIAAAYADDHLDDDALLAAIEDSAFDPATIADRENALENVDAIHDVDFRPYGGQFFDAEQGPDTDVDHDATETW